MHLSKPVLPKGGTYPCWNSTELLCIFIYVDKLGEKLCITNIEHSVWRWCPGWVQRSGVTCLYETGGLLRDWVQRKAFFWKLSEVDLWIISSSLTLTKYTHDFKNSCYVVEDWGKYPSNGNIKSFCLCLFLPSLFPCLSLLFLTHTLRLTHRKMTTLTPLSLFVGAFLVRLKKHKTTKPNKKCNAYLFRSARG